MQPQPPKKLIMSVPPLLNEPQTLSHERKSPAYLRGKDPYGQLLDRIEHAYREPRITTITYWPPSQIGASIEGRLRSSSPLQFKTRPTPLTPSQSEETVPVPDIQTQSPISVHSRKPLSVQSIKDFFESKISQHRSSPLTQGEMSEVVKVASLPTQANDPVMSTVPGPDGALNTKEDDANHNMPPEMPIAEQETNEACPSAVVKQATLLYDMTDYDDDRANLDFENGGKKLSDAISDTISNDASSPTERATDKDSSKFDEVLTSPVAAIKRPKQPEQYQTFEQSVSEYYTFKSQSFANIKESAASKGHAPETEHLCSETCRKFRSSFEEVKQSPSRQLWQSLPGTVPIIVEPNLHGYVGEFAGSSVAECLFMDMDRGLSHDGSSSNPNIIPRSTTSEGISTANIGVQDSYHDVKVPDHVDWRGSYGRRQTLDFGYPGARLKPRRTIRSFKPLPDPDHWVRRACEHFSYLDKGELREYAGQKICRQCANRGPPSSPPSSRRRRSTGKVATQPSPQISPTLSDPRDLDRRNSGRSQRRLKSLSADKCGDSFAQDLKSIINTILEEHANTLQDVINDIKQSQPSIEELQRVSQDLIQRSDAAGVTLALSTTPCRPPYSRQPVCQQACHQPACRPQGSELQPSNTFMSPKAAERLNVGSPGKLKPSINDSRASLQGSIQSIPELLELVNSTADDLGIDLEERPDNEDNETFREAPIEGGSEISTPPCKRISTRIVDERMDPIEEPGDDAWLQQTRRHLDDISETRSHLMDELDSIAEDLGIQIETCHPSNAQVFALPRAPTESPAKQSQSSSRLTINSLPSIAEESPRINERRVSARQLSRTIISASTQSKHGSAASLAWRDLKTIKPDEVQDWLAVARVELPIARNSINTVLAALPPLEPEGPEDSADNEPSDRTDEGQHDLPFPSSPESQRDDVLSERSSSVIARKPTERMSIPRSTIERVLSYQSVAGAPSPEELTEGMLAREQTETLPLPQSSLSLPSSGEDLQFQSEHLVKNMSSRSQSFAPDTQQERAERVPSQPFVKQRITQLNQLNSPISRQPTFARWRAPSQSSERAKTPSRAATVNEVALIVPRTTTRQLSTLSHVSSENTLNQTTEPLVGTTTGLAATSRRVTRPLSGSQAEKSSDDGLLESIDRSTDGQGDDAELGDNQRPSQSRIEAPEQSTRASSDKAERQKILDSRRGTQVNSTLPENPNEVPDESNNDDLDLDDQETIRQSSHSETLEQEQQPWKGLSPAASELESPHSPSSVATSSMKVNRWFTAMEEVATPSDEDKKEEVPGTVARPTTRSTMRLSPPVSDAQEIANDENSSVYSDAEPEREPTRETKPKRQATTTARAMSGPITSPSELREVSPVDETSNGEIPRPVEQATPVSQMENETQVGASQARDDVNSGSGSTPGAVAIASRRTSRVSNSSLSQEFSSPSRKSNPLEDLVETEETPATALSRKATLVSPEPPLRMTTASRHVKVRDKSPSLDSGHSIGEKREEPLMDNEEDPVPGGGPPILSRENTATSKSSIRAGTEALAAEKDEDPDTVEEEHQSEPEPFLSPEPVKKPLLDQPLAVLDIYNASPARPPAVPSESLPMVQEPSSEQDIDSAELEAANSPNGASEPSSQDLPTEQPPDIANPTPTLSIEDSSQVDHAGSPRPSSAEFAHDATLPASSSEHSDVTPLSQTPDKPSDQKTRVPSIPKRLSIFPPASTSGTRKPSTVTFDTRKSRTAAPGIVTPAPITASPTTAVTKAAMERAKSEARDEGKPGRMVHSYPPEQHCPLTPPYPVRNTRTWAKVDANIKLKAEGDRVVKPKSEAKSKPETKPAASKTQRLCRCPSTRKSGMSAASTPEPGIRVRRSTVSRTDEMRVSDPTPAGPAMGRAKTKTMSAKAKGKQRADTASEPLAPSPSPSPSASASSAGPGLSASQAKTKSEDKATADEKVGGGSKGSGKAKTKQHPKIPARRYDYPSPLVPFYARKDDYYRRLGPIVKEEDGRE